jgi:hypothetical protein
MTTYSYIYGSEDIQPGDDVQIKPNGLDRDRIVIVRGNTTFHLCWKDLEDYAGWLERNADSLPNPKYHRRLAKEIRNEIADQLD